MEYTGTLLTSPTFLCSLPLLILCLIYLLYRKSHLLTGSNRLPLPPGFPTKPFIGNLWDMPNEFEWVTYAEWGKILKSDIIHADISGQCVIVLNSAEVATELLDKRASIYSSRPRMPMVNELMGFNWLFAYMPLGDSWAAHRKLFRQEFHHSFYERYLPQTLKATHQMLLGRLLECPEGLFEHLRYMTGAIIMSVSYGIDVRQSNDPYIGTAETAFNGLVVASMPGAFLVDSLPWLKWVPGWFPGASFKRRAARWAHYARQMIDVPFAEVQRCLANGTQKPSFISYCLQNMDMKGDIGYQEKMIKEVSAQLYVAGSDTTVSALEALFLGLTCYPDVVRTAQAQLDAHLKGRFPDFGDREHLPYITAILKETFRWNPVTPVCIPHCTIQEDTYRGYRIPKGATIIPNAWAMLHDPSIYPDPHTFNPSRWLLPSGQLDPSVPDPWVMFGYGRRTCPGQFLPTASVWITCATVLSLFDVGMPMGEDGEFVRPKEVFTSALTIHCVPFQADIKPRSKAAEMKIRAIAAAAKDSGS